MRVCVCVCEKDRGIIRKVSVNERERNPSLYVVYINHCICVTYMTEIGRDTGSIGNIITGQFGNVGG